MLSFVVLLMLQAPTTGRSATGRWVVKTDVSRMDDSKTVTLSLRASNPVSGWPNKTVTPTLVLRCKEGDVVAYVVTGMAPNVEAGNLDGATVMMRFDREPAREMNSGQSTDKESLFLRDPKDLILEMEKRDTLLFRFTPFNSPPQETSFALFGLAAAVRPLKDACGWDPAEEAQEEETEEAQQVEHRLRSLRSPDANTRAMAAKGLRFTPSHAIPRVLPALVEALTDQSSLVRAQAASTLAEFGPRAKDAISALESAVQDVDRLVSAQAKIALSKIRGQ